MYQLGHAFGGVTIIKIVLLFYKTAKIGDIGRFIEVLDLSNELVGILREGKGVERMGTKLSSSLDMPHQIRDKKESGSAQMHEIKDDSGIICDEHIRSEEEFLRIWVRRAGDDGKTVMRETRSSLGQMVKTNTKNPFAAKPLCEG